MPKTYAHIVPAVLTWARESAGLDAEEAARKIAMPAPKLVRAEAGEVLLTLRQAEEAARVYQRPLAVLFLPRPPDEEAPEAQFRRLPGAPALPWSAEMRLLARRITERQEIADSIYDELDEAPPWLGFPVEYVASASALAAKTRHGLGVELSEQKSWRDRAGFLPLKSWRAAVEATGVLVMQDGSMPVTMMRGFAATHPRVPAIVLNTKDDPRARVFTLIHELGHLLRSRAAISTGPGDEKWCDEFASALLMPEASWRQDLAGASFGNRDLVDVIDDIALMYGVTPAAALVRSARLELASRSEVARVRATLEKRGPKGSAGGGDHFTNVLSRVGPSFARLVFDGLDANAISAASASRLLGSRVDGFGELARRLGNPAGVA